MYDVLFAAPTTEPTKNFPHAFSGKPMSKFSDCALSLFIHRYGLTNAKATQPFGKLG